MLRLAGLGLVIMLTLAGAAVASGPQKRINPADQARARSMLLKQADVGLGFTQLRGGSSSGVDTDCPALDESDLTVTGNAESKFTSGIHTIFSGATVYVSVRDASTSWRHGTSTAGSNCLTKGFKQVARANNFRVVSFHEVPFPRVAPRTVAYRMQALVGTIRVYADFVFVMQGRALAVEFFIAPLDPFDRDEQVRLTRLVSKRMAKAMRGA
jgi:hypothetical protein